MEAIFQAVDLDIKYHTRQATLTAVRHVNFDVKAGQIVGLVGGRARLERAQVSPRF